MDGKQPFTGHIEVIAVPGFTTKEQIVMLQLYPKAKEAFLRGEINLMTDTIKVMAVDLDDYAFSSTHEYLSSIPAAARIGEATMSGITVTNGVFDASNTVIHSVPDGLDTFEGLVIYQDTGEDASSRLIHFIDGLNLTPNGNNINVNWSDGAAKIFAL